ncbi:MAG: flagellar basal body-associated FliL family protein [Pseudomonadales bacterium]|nr:flagellar basal body-associated FliL family protein [Pseudomonadales bacterium]
MADQEDEELEAVAAAGKGKKKLIIMAGAGILVLALAAAAYLFLFAGADETETVAETTAAAETSARNNQPMQYIELSPAFIINFPHQGRQRFLQTNLAVMTRDPQMIQAISQHMPIIRNNLINLFSAQLLLVFEDPTGIEALREMATEEVKQILLTETGRENIEEVLFTSFVMQ